MIKSLFRLRRLTSMINSTRQSMIAIPLRFSCASIHLIPCTWNWNLWIPLFSVFVRVLASYLNCHHKPRKDIVNLEIEQGFNGVLSRMISSFPKNGALQSAFQFKTEIHPWWSRTDCAPIRTWTDFPPTPHSWHNLNPLQALSLQTFRWRLSGPA